MNWQAAAHRIGEWEQEVRELFKRALEGDRKARKEVERRFKCKVVSHEDLRELGHQCSGS